MRASLPELPAAMAQRFQTTDGLPADDAAVDAQRSSAQNQSIELVRINALYDIELERLKRLWDGAQPGSLRPVPVPLPVPPPALLPAPTPAPTPTVLKPASSAAAR